MDAENLIRQPGTATNTSAHLALGLSISTNFNHTGLRPLEVGQKDLVHLSVSLLAHCLGTKVSTEVDCNVARLERSKVHARCCCFGSGRYDGVLRALQPIVAARRGGRGRWWCYCSGLCGQRHTRALAQHCAGSLLQNATLRSRALLIHALLGRATEPRRATARWLLHRSSTHWQAHWRLHASSAHLSAYLRYGHRESTGLWHRGSQGGSLLEAWHDLTHHHRRLLRHLLYLLLVHLLLVHASRLCVFLRHCLRHRVRGLQKSVPAVHRVRRNGDHGNAEDCGGRHPQRRHANRTRMRG
mmetsp:Transcript_69659/g.113011  ORF Transcript_69659/g.113011 Transcript_69659/m.113011 type:complete len:299 (-) Transcript_69659:62-958(-)